jgi:hypothetical protein
MKILDYWFGIIIFIFIRCRRFITLNRTHRYRRYELRNSLFTPRFCPKYFIWKSWNRIVALNRRCHLVFLLGDRTDIVQAFLTLVTVFPHSPNYFTDIDLIVLQFNIFNFIIISDFNFIYLIKVFIKFLGRFSFVFDLFCNHTVVRVFLLLSFFYEVRFEFYVFFVMLLNHGSYRFNVIIKILILPKPLRIRPILPTYIRSNHRCLSNFFFNSLEWTIHDNRRIRRFSMQVRTSILLHLQTWFQNNLLCLRLDQIMVSVSFADLRNV